MIAFPGASLIEGLEAFGLAFALALLLSPAIMAMLRAMKSRQSIHSHAPDAHKKKEGTPTMGGVVVLAGVVPTLIVNGLRNGPSLYWAAGLAAAFGFIGFVDDYLVPKMYPGKRGLSWLPKLVMQVAAATLAAPVLGLPFHVLTWGAVVFVVLFFANAYNFADGLDSLAGSVGIAFAVALTAILLIVQPFANLAPLMAIVGALIPFLFINAPPARVFMGDVGSLPIGALFGMMALVPLRDALLSVADPVAFAAESHPELTIASSAMVLPILVLSLLMVAELVPVPMQVAYFKLTKGKRLFPMTPIHHAFEKKGWPESRVVWSFLWTQVLLGVAALAMTVQLLPSPPTGGR